MFIRAAILRGQRGFVKGRAMQWLGQGSLLNQFTADTEAFNRSGVSKDCPSRPRRGMAPDEF